VGHANYTTVEGIAMGEEVLACTLFLNEHPVIILFDSGVSHDFISSTCAKEGDAIYGGYGSTICD
jgi:hypothetical protein